jgi:hypothetical protein
MLIEESQSLALVGSGANHKFGSDQGIEFLLSEGIKLQSTLLQSETLFVSILGNFAGHVITNFGIEACDKHKTVKI